MTPDFVDAFIHTVPDLASWFMVRLTITEEFVPAKSRSLIRLRRFHRKSRNVGSMKRCDTRPALVERFHRAKEGNARTGDLLDLARMAAEAIAEVGAPKLTEDLANSIPA